MRICRIGCAVLVGMVAADGVSADQQHWAVDASAGYAGFVDDATKSYALVGGSLRRYLSTRVSIGPELVVMWGSDAVRDRAVMLTANVMADFGFSDPALARITPFLVGGIGRFWGRDIVRGGPFWSNDPAFTAGGGMRIHISRHLGMAAEYRIGWELHQRLSGALTARW